VPSISRILVLTRVLEQFLPDLDVLEAKAISHSLASFSFSKDTFTFDDTTFFRDDTRRDDSDAEDDFGDNEPFPMEPMDIDGGTGGEDFFTGDQGVHEDYNGDMPVPGNGDDNDYSGSGGEGGQPVAGSAFVPFDPRRVPNERDLVMAMTGDGEEGSGMMDYFDQNFLKNWAGPEHWKLRKVVRRRKLPTSFILRLTVDSFFTFVFQRTHRRRLSRRHHGRRRKHSGSISRLLPTKTSKRQRRTSSLL
jgi:condensin complex subunit 2